MQTFNALLAAGMLHDSQHVPSLGPITTPHVQFDFATVSADLGEPAEIEIEGRDYEALAIALRRIVRWLVSDANAVAQRTICFAHALGVMDGKPSLRELAERTGTDKSKLSLVTIAVRKEFTLPTPAKTGGRRVRV